MSAAKGIIQRMRAEMAETRAGEKKLTDAPLYYVHTSDLHMTIRLRKLLVGEMRRRGDLWLDLTNRLRPLAPSPWWKRIFGCGYVNESHPDHYRVMP